jgi:hypothetical protein
MGHVCGEAALYYERLEPLRGTTTFQQPLGPGDALKT